jgi:FkbM family methyltransferase
MRETRNATIGLKFFHIETTRKVIIGCLVVYVCWMMHVYLKQNYEEKPNDVVLLLSSEFLHIHETIKLSLADAVKEGVKIGRLSVPIRMREKTTDQGGKVVLSHALPDSSLASTRAPPQLISVPINTKTFQANPGARIAHVSCDGTTFDMFVHDPAICIYISQYLLNGAWECATISAILAIMKKKPDGERGYFMDIGANIGALSLAVAHSGFNVVAFEAMTFNIELHQASVGTFPPSGKLHLFHTALSSADGKEMCVAAAKGGEPTVNSGNGQLTYNCEPSSEHVSLRSIDSILAQDKILNEMCFTVIKADIEGFESLAFEGAKNIFTGTCPPCAVFLEYNKEYTLMATNVERAPFNFLSAHGYSCEVVKDADYRCNLTTSPYKDRCL